jgi:hypothetical protein
MKVNIFLAVASGFLLFLKLVLDSPATQAFSGLLVIIIPLLVIRIVYRLISRGGNPSLSKTKNSWDKYTDEQSDDYDPDFADELKKIQKIAVDKKNK